MRPWHFIAFLVAGWPGFVLGYLWSSFRSSWEVGGDLEGRHACDASDWMDRKRAEKEGRK